VRDKWLGVFVAALIGAALVAGGCGSSGDSSSEESITKKQFIAQADAICQKAEKTRREDVATYAQEQGKELQQFSKPELEAMITDIALPPMSTMAEELDDLPRPTGDEEKVTAIVEGFEDAVAKAEENPLAVLSQSTGPFAGALKTAKAYGLTDCAEVS
jgi:hypothetical protein